MIRKTVAAGLMTAAFVLLTGCGSGAPAAHTEQVSETARKNLGFTMVAWELQTDTEQHRLCGEVLKYGVSGTVESYQSKHGGLASDWTLSAEWLTDTCRGM